MKGNISKELVSISDDFITTKSYFIRGKKVMLDFDLAAFYEVEISTLKRRVKGNLHRFPSGFMFMLTKAEWKEIIRLSAHLPESIRLSAVLPVAFTAEGIAMLSSVLNSERAVAVNIAIIRKFVKMRHLMSSYTHLWRKYEEMKGSDIDQDMKTHIIFQTIKELREPEIKNRKKIGFKISSKENKL